MTLKDPRIGRPVQRNVQVEGSWYFIGDVPPTRHALMITNPRVWGDDMGEVPGPGQFETDDDGNVVPPGGELVQPNEDDPNAMKQPGTEAPAEVSKRTKK